MAGNRCSSFAANTATSRGSHKDHSELWGKGCKNGKRQRAKGAAAAFALFVVVGVMVQKNNSGSTQSPTVKPPFKTVNGGFMALSVPDLDASAKWYEEKLGLKIVKHAAAPDKAATILQGNGLSVELVWFANAVPLAKVAPQLQGSHQLHGIFKSGIFVDDLDDALKALKSRNVTMAFETFYDKSMDCRMFAIRDNNGNILQFFGK
jgi:catechol 2,3-dioxygenase-like lactoylglutathione lyase family enzyme